MNSRRENCSESRRGPWSSAFAAAHQPRPCDWQGHGTLLWSAYLNEEQKDLTGPALLRPDLGIAVKPRN